MLVCDLDGTLINEELGLEFRKWLFRNGHFGFGRIFLAFLFNPINIISRTMNRGAIFSAWSSFRKKSDSEDLVKRFISESHSIFNFNQRVISTIESYDGEKVLLSGSDKILISELLRFFDFRLFDKVIGSETKYFGLLFSIQPLGKGKLIVDSPRLAIGDSWQDRFLLMNSSKAMIVGGDRRLNNLAKEQGWERLS
tara:strand:+ start:943 stop:1530 length:588 start_codon:yes stop_codon:yes gene_type:complete